MKTLAAVLMSTVLAFAAQPEAVNFDSATVGTAPTGWTATRTGSGNAKWTLDVSDNGPGIPAELRSRIFDRFYRIDKSRSRENGGGTGLGLSIAKWAVEVNGGELTLEAAKGPGTTFRITLPQTAAGNGTQEAQNRAQEAQEKIS